MDEKTSVKILKYIENKGQATGSELAHYLPITSRAIRKQLNNLLGEGVLYKNGKPPKDFYLINKEEKIKSTSNISESLKKIIDENYLIITPTGEKKEGWGGFEYWCEKQKLP